MPDATTKGDLMDNLLDRATPAVSAPGFQGGGTLRATAIYVHRKADDELLDALLLSEYCHVLAPRQIGKSSLRVQTARALLAKGVRSVTIDLTAIGDRESTASMWYFDLIAVTARQLHLPDPSLYWNSKSEMSPLLRWLEYMRRYVLDEIKDPIVLFIDEIDAILSRSSIARDDFFAAIRSIFNARAEDRTLDRLTICLIGVALPGDLIQDETRTPFNIGRSVVLEDFSREELQALRIDRKSVV